MLLVVQPGQHVEDHLGLQHGQPPTGLTIEHGDVESHLRRITAGNRALCRLPVTASRRLAIGRGRHPAMSTVVRLRGGRSVPVRYFWIGGARDVDRGKEQTVRCRLGPVAGGGGAGFRHGRVGHVRRQALTLRDYKFGPPIGKRAPCRTTRIARRRPVEQDPQRVEHTGQTPDVLTSGGTGAAWSANVISDRLHRIFAHLNKIIFCWSACPGRPPRAVDEIALWCGAPARPVRAPIRRPGRSVTPSAPRPARPSAPTSTTPPSPSAVRRPRRTASVPVACSPSPTVPTASALVPLRGDQL